MINDEAVQALVKYLNKNPETGTPLNVLVYKAFIGEPVYPNLFGTESKAPFFYCDKERVKMAPEPPYYSTKFSDTLDLIKYVFPYSRLSLVEHDNDLWSFIISNNIKKYSKAMGMDTSDFHVAALRALVRAYKLGWETPHRRPVEVESC